MKSQVPFQVVIVFVSGILIGMSITCYYQSAFDFKLSSGDILLSATTVFLAWIVSVVWRNQQYQQDGITELLIARIEQIQTHLQELRKSSLSFFNQAWNQPLWQTSVLLTLRQIANLMEEAGELSEAYFAINKLANSKRNYYRLKGKLTNFSPTNLPGAQDFVILDRHFTELRQALIRITIDIYKR